MKKTIAISVTEGRVVRDLFHNGMLDLLLERGHEVLILTPAARVPDFVKKWQRAGVRILPLVPYKLGLRDERLLAVRRRAMRLGGMLLPLWLWIEKKLWRADPHMIELLKEHDCCMAVITHPM